MWINEKTQGIFVLHSDIRYECYKDEKTLPGILTDDVLLANGYALVTQIKPVFNNITEKLMAKPPVKINEIWTIEYEIVGLDPAIIANNQNILKVQQIEYIQNQINNGNIAIVNAIINNDTGAIDAWKIKSAELTAQLQNIS